VRLTFNAPCGRRSKSTWVRLLALGIVGASLVALSMGAYTRWRSDRIRENEQAASIAIKSLSVAEADFRANDRDWNHVNDFWTGDVAGLYYVRPNDGTNAPEIGLIPREVAEADAAPLKALVPVPVPYHGYFFIALIEDDSLKGSAESIFRQDTGGSPPMGKVHNTSKFGFCAYPAEYGVTGKFTFLINENNTVFKLDNGGKPAMAWPDDSPPRKSDWDGHYQKLD
jgi:hypothetical protein